MKVYLLGKELPTMRNFQVGKVMAAW